MIKDTLISLKESATFHEALQHLTDYLRQAENASDALRELLEGLKAAPEISDYLGNLMHEWLQNASLYFGFVQTGIYSRHGFFRELKRRVYDRFNPPPRRKHELDALLQSVLRPSDLEWLETITPLQWLMLYRELSKDRHAESHESVRLQLLHAAERLVLWIAAEDLDPDLIRLEPRLLDFDSPFISLQREVQEYIDAMRARGLDDDDTPPDSAAIEVMLAQSREQIAHLKRLGSHTSASLTTAHLLERLEQSLDRLEGLIAILAGDSAEKSARAFLEQLGQMISSSLEQRSIRGFVRSASGMLSKSISTSKSHHGEHYITTTRADYRYMFVSAAGAGVIIALMALLKIHIVRWGLPAFWEAVCISLNYGIGFVIVHLLGFTIATKQPAMTAASLAAAVEQGQNSRTLAKRLAELLVQVNRSQSIAVLGNLSIAMFVAALISWLWQQWQGAPILSPQESDYQLKTLQPIPALWYAAIAALWLFCAGIISGYYDNRANYLQLGERLAAHPLLAFLGAKRRQGFADYMHHNFGALHGNFAFGILLGITPFIGDLLHLPLDIRHIAFSSANLSYAAVSGGFAASVVALGIVYVLLIGMVNLWASFFLALKVALRARDANIPGIGKLMQALWAEIKSKPSALLFPPRDEKSAEKE